MPNDMFENPSSDNFEDWNMNLLARNALGIIGYFMHQSRAKSNASDVADDVRNFEFLKATTPTKISNN